MNVDYRQVQSTSNDQKNETNIDEFAVREIFETNFVELNCSSVVVVDPTSETSRSDRPLSLRARHREPSDLNEKKNQFVSFARKSERKIDRDLLTKADWNSCWACSRVAPLCRYKRWTWKQTKPAAEDSFSLSCRSFSLWSKEVRRPKQSLRNRQSPPAKVNRRKSLGHRRRIISPLKWNRWKHRRKRFSFARSKREREKNKEFHHPKLPMPKACSAVIIIWMKKTRKKIIKLEALSSLNAGENRRNEKPIEKRRKPHRNAR